MPEYPEESMVRARKAIEIARYHRRLEPP